jgi:hypothetical protein
MGGMAGGHMGGVRAGSHFAGRGPVVTHGRGRSFAHNGHGHFVNGVWVGGFWPGYGYGIALAFRHTRINNASSAIINADQRSS